MFRVILILFVFTFIACQKNGETPSIEGFSLLRAGQDVRCNPNQANSYSIHFNWNRTQLAGVNVPQDKPTNFVPDELQTLFNEMVFLEEESRRIDNGLIIPVEIFVKWRPYLISKHKKLEGGWLAAFDKGEWGGLLLWITDEGDHQVLKEVTPMPDSHGSEDLNFDMAIIKHWLHKKDELITITEGADYWADSFATFYERKDQSFEKVMTVKLPASVAAMDYDRGNLMIVTQNAVFQVSKTDGAISLLSEIPPAMMRKIKTVQIIRPDLIGFGGIDYLSLMKLTPKLKPNIYPFAPNHCVLP